MEQRTQASNVLVLQTKLNILRIEMKGHTEKYAYLVARSSGLGSECFRQNSITRASRALRTNECLKKRILSFNLRAIHYSGHNNCRSNGFAVPEAQ